MPTTLQLRRGTTAEQNAFTGAVGEVTVDTTLKQLRLHDGSTAGGFVVGEDSDAINGKMSVANTQTLFSNATANLNSYIANTNPRIAWLDGNGQASAALIPATNNAIDLGSIGRVWRDVYIGPGSLYVNGKKVIEDDSDTITITTDLNQNLKVATSGSGVNQVEAGAGGIAVSTSLGSSGDITINADGNIELLSTVQIQSGKRITDSAGTNVEYGDNIEMNNNKITGLGTPTNSTDAATKDYVDNSGGITAVTYTGANGNIRIQTNDGTTHDATISTNDKMEVANTQALFTTVSANVSQAFTDIQATNTAIRAITTTNANKIAQVEANLLASNTAIRGYVDSEVANLVDSAPATLDTLNELAAALGDDANFATTVSTNIGQKLGATASVTLTGDVSGSASFSANAVSITTTVADDSHNHVISNVDGLQAALDNRMTVANTQALANARLGAGASVTLTGDVTGTASFSSNAVSITTTVADDSHNHIISNVDGLQSALDNKMSVANTQALANARLGAGASVTLTGDVTGSGSFSANAVSFATSIASNVVGAAELNVSGNGSAGQYLASDGDGTFTWTNIPAGYGDSDVDAHLSGGTGVTYSSGTISIGQAVGTADSVTFASVTATGDITANSSDRRLKNVSGNIENAVDKVKALNGVHFTWNETAAELDPVNHSMDKQNVGLIAQEVEAVLPEIIRDAPIGEGYLTLMYDRVVPLLVEAIKEQQEQIEELKSQLHSH